MILYRYVYECWGMCIWRYMIICRNGQKRVMVVIPHNNNNNHKYAIANY